MVDTQGSNIPNTHVIEIHLVEKIPKVNGITSNTKEVMGW